jgi:hypothetical protein
MLDTNAILFRCGIAAAGAVSALINSTAHAVVVPSTFTTAIQVQGESAGTEFNDWASSGIPIATIDPADNTGFIDINEIQIANDDQYIYLRISYHNNNSVNTYLAFDTDQDVATGFNIFSLGLVGSELGYQNDFPFEQETGVFNTTHPLTASTALIFPFWNIDGPQKEYAIPLNATFTNPLEPAFTGNSFDLVVYTDQGLADVSEVLSYTLAAGPSGPAGDFDDDGDVDGNDFLIWQRGESPNALSPGDLTEFRNNFGMSSTVAAAAAIPEPATLLLATCAVTAFVLRRHRRQRHPYRESFCLGSGS